MRRSAYCHHALTPNLTHSVGSARVLRHANSVVEEESKLIRKPCREYRRSACSRSFGAVCLHHHQPPQGLSTRLCLEAVLALLLGLFVVVAVGVTWCPLCCPSQNQTYRASALRGGIWCRVRPLMQALIVSHGTSLGATAPRHKRCSLEPKVAYLKDGHFFFLFVRSHYLEIHGR